MTNTYQPILGQQNPLLLHPFTPRTAEGKTCRWCSVPHEQHIAPYYHLVPKDLQANLEWRTRLLDIGASDPSSRGTLIEMCRADVLFYLNSFGWIFEPRESLEIPFLTYPFQDEFLLILKNAMGRHDLVVEKSRDMGASWCCIAAPQHEWMFSRNIATFLFLSRKEELVDKSGDPKSLFWKFDYLTQRLPHWMMPPVEAMKMHRRNAANGSSVDGESTNEFAGVADRRLTLLLDEFSKMPNQDMILKGTRDVTRSRWFLYTPQGAANEAYQIAQNPDFPRVSLHWSMHPDKCRGLYRVGAGGAPEILDHKYWTPERVAAYRFADEPPKNPRYHFRSPWYDAECRRALHQNEIAEELDIDYLGSNHGFYDSTVIEELVKETAREPFHIGELEYDRDSCEPIRFSDGGGGRLRLWVHPDGRGRLPEGGRRYVVGADVSMGVGGKYSSESTLSVVDRDTGEKVAEFVDGTIAPQDHAKHAIALCRWFSSGERSGAMLIWESNGPGQMFGREVMKQRYGNIFYREQGENRARLTPKKKQLPGFHASEGPDGTKVMLHATYRQALAERRFINRSAGALREAKQYVWTVDRKVEHQQSAASKDPTATGANHGDRVVADALACLCLSERRPDEVVEQIVPVNSVGARIKAFRRYQATSKKNSWRP